MQLWQEQYHYCHQQSHFLTRSSNYWEIFKHFNSEDIDIPCLPQSKFHLEIIGISYLSENTNIPITLDVVETIIKNNHIFNNIAVILKSCVIKILPKLDITIIWLDIWDVQSSSKAKELINRCFNVGNYCHYSRCKYKSRSLSIQELLKIEVYNIFLLSSRFKIH